MYWKLEKKLSSEKQNLLDLVGFPKELKVHQYLQKRIAKQITVGGYINNSSPSLSEIQYLIVPKNVALYQKSIQPTPETAKAKSTQHQYISPNEMEGELDWILNTYGSPVATPSMKKKQVTKIKTLTDQEKATIEKLIDEGKSVKEISNELKLTQKMIKSYIIDIEHGQV